MENKIYKARFKNIMFRDRLWNVLVEDFFQNFVKNSDVVLDVACGYCEFINNIKCKIKIATDLNPDSRKYAKKGVRFMLGKSSKMNLAKNSVDLVFVSNFFEHISRAEIVKTIAELFRVLKKGGRLVVLQPNIRFCAKDYWMFFDHITPIDDRALEEICNLNGLKLTQRILKFLPYTTKSRVPKDLLLVKLYLRLPLIWSLFGKQSLLVFEK